jgi:hypothetical protein
VRYIIEARRRRLYQKMLEEQKNGCQHENLKPEDLVCPDCKHLLIPANAFEEDYEDG